MENEIQVSNFHRDELAKPTFRAIALPRSGIENFCGCTYMEKRGYVIDGNMVTFVDSMGTGLKPPQLLCEVDFKRRNR